MSKKDEKGDYSKMKKLVFTDVDGFKVYRNDRGDLVDREGNLIGIEAEAAIRVSIGEWERTGLEYE